MPTPINLSQVVNSLNSSEGHPTILPKIFKYNGKCYIQGTNSQKIEVQVTPLDIVTFLRKIRCSLPKDTDNTIYSSDKKMQKFCFIEAEETISSGETITVLKMVEEFPEDSIEYSFNDLLKHYSSFAFHDKKLVHTMKNLINKSSRCSGVNLYKFVNEMISHICENSLQEHTEQFRSWLIDPKHDSKSVDAFQDNDDVMMHNFSLVENPIPVKTSLEEELAEDYELPYCQRPEQKQCTLNNSPKDYKIPEVDISAFDLPCIQEELDQANNSHCFLQEDGSSIRMNNNDAHKYVGCYAKIQMFRKIRHQLFQLMTSEEAQNCNAKELCFVWKKSDNGHSCLELSFKNNHAGRCELDLIHTTNSLLKCALSSNCKIPNLKSLEPANYLEWLNQAIDSLLRTGNFTKVMPYFMNPNFDSNLKSDPRKFTGEIRAFTPAQQRKEFQLFTGGETIESQQITKLQKEWIEMSYYGNAFFTRFFDDSSTKFIPKELELPVGTMPDMNAYSETFWKSVMKTWKDRCKSLFGNLLNIFKWLFGSHPEVVEQPLPNHEVHNNLLNQATLSAY